MKLLVVTPFDRVVDADGVRRVRAEDASGSFAILRGHAPLLTVLEVSVLSYIDAQGVERHVAVRGGTFSVERGNRVRVATREAIAGEDLAKLERDVVEAMRRSAAAAESARAVAVGLERGLLRHAVRQIRRGSRATDGLLAAFGDGR